METLTATEYSRRAADYAAHRPQYAHEAIISLLEITGLRSSWVVADVGSGTGNVARHLVERAQLVHAVEPDDAMRRHAERLLAGYRSFRSIAGTAEYTTLADQAVDLITVGQALHWFDQSAAQAEFARILKPEGWLALLWNVFDEQHDPALAAVFAGGQCARRSVPVTFSSTWEQYIGGARSAAGAPCPGDAGYDAFERDHRKKFDAGSSDGLMTVRYTTELAVGRLNRPTDPSL